MTRIFLSIVNMSIAASWILIAVLFLRLVLKRAPKWLTVVLWGIVAVRLVCPFSIESALSLIPSAKTVNPSIMTDTVPAVNTGFIALDSTLNPIINESFAPEISESANPLQVFIPIVTAVWAIGIAVLVAYAVISYVRLKRKIGTSVLYKDNIYQSENVVSPFVLGLIKPRVYLPLGISERDMAHVVAHEQSHIKRKDHIWKPLGFLILTLHWFNPLMWLGYVLLCRDIELACDEKVIKELDRDARADYSQALISCSVNRRTIAACPLAFGEVGVVSRVRSVLSYKKPAFWIIIAAIIVCTATAACFLTSPSTDTGVYRISVSKAGFDGIKIKLKYSNPTGRYSVVPVDVTEGEYCGDGIKDYDGSLGRYRILIKFGDTDPTGELAEKYPAGEAVELTGVSEKIMIKRVHPQDHGFYLYIGFERPVSIESVDSAQLTGRSGTVTIPISFDGDDEQAKTESEIILSDAQIALMEQYPEYFGLDATNGLDVYVWQMAKNSYSFGLLPHSEQGREWLSDELINLKGVRAEEMRTILSAYDIDEQEIYVILWSHPLSSYLSEWQIIADGEDIEAKREACVEYVKQMLFGGNLSTDEGSDTKLEWQDPTVTLVFDAPIYSYVTSQVPMITIYNSARLFDLSGKQLGSVEEIGTGLTDFLIQMGSYGSEYKDQAYEIKDNVRTAYSVNLLEPEAIDLYYILIQEDGSTLLVYGHYLGDKKKDEIRWIFRLS